MNLVNSSKPRWCDWKYQNLLQWLRVHSISTEFNRIPVLEPQKIGGKHHPKICVLSPPLVVLPAYVFYIEDYFVIWREKNCRNLHYGWTAKCIIIGGNWHKFICLFVCFHNIKNEFSEFAQIYKLLVFWQLLMKQHSWTLLTVCK